jgi:hypothetical protein
MLPRLVNERWSRSAGTARSACSPMIVITHSARGVGVGGCGRIPRVWGWEDIARCPVRCWRRWPIPEFQARVYGIVKCGDVLWNLRNPALDIVGTGYYHPVLPLIPAADREEHVQRWLALARHLFARGNFSGFWPPECGFSMEMIPILQRAGFRYVIVDSEHIVPMTPMRWEELRYRPTSRNSATAKSWSFPATATCPSPRRAAWRWAGS